MAERVAQALGLFADTSFFDKMALSPPDPEPGIARDKQLRDAVIEAILDNLSGTLPRDSRVITIAFTSPDPALAARIADRKRVVEGKSGSVRVDIGGRGISKKKKKKYYKYQQKRK